MGVKYVTGDLIKMALDGNFSVVIHGTNCFNTMGAGIAKQIKETFPKAYKADQRTTLGDKTKLGSFSEAKCQISDRSIIVCNLYTQYKYGSLVKDVDYRHLEESLVAVREKYWLYDIGSPIIGNGLGRGNKRVILDIYEDVFRHVDITVVTKPIVFK